MFSQIRLHKEGIFFQGLFLLAFLLFDPIAYAVEPGIVELQMVNASNQSPVADVKVTAYRQEGENLKWFQRRTTDDDGRAEFELKDIESGSQYIFKANPFNTGNVYSGPATQSGTFDFNVGTSKIDVIKGSDNAPLANHKITAYKRLDNGEREWNRSGYTNAQGTLYFDLPGINSGTTYFLRTKSLFDNRNKVSEDLSKAGRYTFTVGNRLLNVSLKNGINENPLPNILIRAYEVLKDGSLKGRQKGTTNSKGQVDFDLPGLGNDRTYQLRAKSYNTGSVSSENITQTGPFEFRVGTFEVKVISGVDDRILPDHKITAYKRLDNGERKWYRSGTTDKDGIVRFDLDGLGAGTKYLLRTKSPFDGRTKTSEDLSQAGQYTFTVGNRLLNVALQNGVSQAPLANTVVNAYQILADGSRTGWREGTTDEEGRVDFDLPGLGKERNYQLRTLPYNTGSVKSSIITKTGPFTFSVGTVPITLRDADKNQVLAERKIVFYEKNGDGKLKWRSSGYTNTLGIVYFDPPSFDNGQVYIARAHNLFGQEKRYFSPWVLQVGAVDFAVREGESTSPDLTPPSLTISNPSEGAKVSNAGFILRGRASDDRGIADVSVSIVDVNVGVTDAAAKYINGFWEFPVTESMISANEKVVLTVKATDTAKNTVELSRNVEVIIDNESPILTITSHQDGDKVVDSGFLVSGIATDNVSVSQLRATVQNSADGVIINQQPVEIANSSGRWALAVGSVSSGVPVQVTLSASDVAGNTATVSLEVVSVPINAVQLINRTTYGATPELLEEVRRVGPVAYLDEQLNPQTIDDSTFESRLVSLGEPDSVKDLQNFQLLRAIYSRRQLSEMMTAFWDNHFNTDINKSRRVSYELSENRKFRENALGRFRDLLEISVSSPAMLIYLDNATSHKDDPNENHSREALELHSLGVDGGFTQQDVVELARILTGWRVRDRRFYFDPRYHDNGEKIFLREVIPAGSGMLGGLQALDIIATHSSTAEFICHKLSQLFVNDHPSQALVDDCAAAYFASYDEPDQIARMVELIIRSPEFNSVGQVHSKVKTPLEFVAGLVRNLKAVASTRYSRDALSGMGMLLFQNPVPTGWPEVGPGWVNSNQMLQRIQHSSLVTFNRARERLTHLNDTVGFFRNRGFETPEGIVGYLFELLMANDYSQLEWDKAVGILTDGGFVPFDINAENAERKLRTLIAMMLSYPSYQLQ